jgi:hypothetical protein
MSSKNTLLSRKRILKNEATLSDRPACLQAGRPVERFQVFHSAFGRTPKQSFGLATVFVFPILIIFLLLLFQICSSEN